MKDLFNSITKKEWRFVAVFCLAIILITSIPYLVGFFSAKEGFTYNGLRALSPGDFPVYYSYIDQVKNGEFFVKNLFTSEQQDIGTFNVWWTWVGLMARFFNLPSALAFHLSRILTIPFFVVISYLFISYFFIEKIKRKVAWIFLFFSSGLGFYFIPAFESIEFSEADRYWWPIDLWLTEATTFNVISQTSHFIASIGLMLLIFLLTLLSFEKRFFSYALASGFLALFYFNFHPYYFPVIFGVFGLYLFWLMFKKNKFLWRELYYLILVFLLSFPSVIYHFWLIKSNPVIGQRALQNVTTISPFIFVLIGYGFLWPGLIFGLFFIFKQKRLNNHFTFLISWLIVNLCLIYSPFPFNSRYTQGLHVILVIFTVEGLFGIWFYLKSKINPDIFNFWINNKALMLMLFVVLFMPSVIFNYFRDPLIFIKKPTVQSERLFFLSNDLMESFQWLRQKPSGKVVLASGISSKFIPGFSGKTAYFAHDHETIYSYSKAVWVFWFFSDNGNNIAKKRFLSEQGIDYILFSDYEKEIGNFDLAAEDYLELVFFRPGAQIYKVAKD